MLIMVKMPTIVGILTFMSMINLCLVEVSTKKSFITLDKCSSPLYFVVLSVNDVMNQVKRTNLT